jgi:hypothetical protein
VCTSLPNLGRLAFPLPIVKPDNAMEDPLARSAIVKPAPLVTRTDTLMVEDSWHQEPTAPTSLTNWGTMWSGTAPGRKNL